MGLETAAQDIGTKETETTSLEQGLTITPSEELTRWQGFKEWYFEPKAFERRGTVYKWMLIKPAKKFFTKVLNRKKDHLLENSEEGIRLYLQRVREAEGDHIAWFMVKNAITGVLLYKGWNEIAAGVAAFNVAWNVYPIFTQRCNRARIYNFFERMEERRARIKGTGESSVSMD